MMDEVSGGKRIGNKAIKWSGLLLRETTGLRTESCSKSGCSSRLNNASGGQIGFSQKAKYMRSSSIRSTCTAGKEVASRNNNSAAITCNLTKETTHIKKHSSSSRTTSSKELGVIEMEVVGSASSSDSSSQSQEGGSCFSGKGKMSCRSSSTLASPVSVGRRKLMTAANGGGQGRLKSIKCNSMSDAVVPVPSSNRSRLNRKDAAIKSSRNFLGETSSSRAKKKMVVGSSQNPLRRSGLSVPESSRLSMNETVSGRRPPNRSCFHRVRSERNSPPPSSSSSSSSLHTRDLCCTSPIIPIDGNASNSSLLSSERISLRRRRHLGGISIRPGSNSATSSAGNTDTPPRSLLQQYNSFEGIAEVVTAFERIERRNGGLRLAYEQQVLAMGFLTDLTTTFDQHRDMRMDIDDMSYEELLALEERIGTVSTALTEEALSKCLKTYLYPTPPLSCNGRKSISSSENNNNDTKCSICQEEYSSGEEVGRLLCEHMYHVQCITQWLRLKNWCPICKASAESNSSSTHQNFAMMR